LTRCLAASAEFEAPSLSHVGFRARKGLSLRRYRVRSGACTSNDTELEKLKRRLHVRIHLFSSVSGAIRRLGPGVPSPRVLPPHIPNRTSLSLSLSLCAHAGSLPMAARLPTPGLRYRDNRSARTQAAPVSVGDGAQGDSEREHADGGFPHLDRGFPHLAQTGFMDRWLGCGSHVDRSASVYPGPTPGPARHGSQARRQRLVSPVRLETRPVAGPLGAERRVGG
jgi:hypothetical protein